MTTARFPDLRVVPIEQCLLHEQTDDARVARLAARLKADGMLRNPPVLGRHDGLDSLIVLDGATRVTACAADRAAVCRRAGGGLRRRRDPAAHLEPCA